MNPYMYFTCENIHKCLLKLNILVFEHTYSFKNLHYIKSL